MMMIGGRRREGGGPGRPALWAKAIVSIRGFPSDVEGGVAEGGEAADDEEHRRQEERRRWRRRGGASPSGDVHGQIRGCGPRAWRPRIEERAGACGRHSRWLKDERGALGDGAAEPERDAADRVPVAHKGPPAGITARDDARLVVSPLPTVMTPTPRMCSQIASRQALRRRPRSIRRTARPRRR